MSQKLSTYPCPICHNMMVIISTTDKGKKLASCGHTFKFKKTRSEKKMDQKYIKTEYGLERIK